MRIERVTDAAGARDWHAVDAAVVPADHPGLVAEPVEAVLALLPAGTAAEWVGQYVGYDDAGAPVAHGRVTLPLRDNPHLANGELAVLPDRRRRGYGGALFDALVAVAREAGRRTVVLEAAGPLDGTNPAEAFLAARGAAPALASIRRELALAGLDEARLAELQADALARSTGYRVVAWVDRAPDELVDDAAALMGRMATDAPMGELDWGAETWDAARYREKEEQAQRRGCVRVATGAVHEASGRMVAYTDIGVYPSQPALAEQWDTIVAPAHRGRRLGLLVKLANLRLLRATVPGVERVTTWNAASNAYMVPINEALGFRAVERGNEWQLVGDGAPGHRAAKVPATPGGSVA